MKKILTTVATGAAIALIPASQVFACHYQISGNGDCQSDGKYHINWVIDNRGNNDDLDITYANVPGLVGTEVHANEIIHFNQVVTSNHVNTVYQLHLNGHLNSRGHGKGHDHDFEHDNEELTATVRTDKDCELPKPVPTPTPQQPQQPTGSKGAGSVNSTTTVTPAPATAQQPAAQTGSQVVAPKGAVNAGTGTTVTRVNPAAILGLTGSLAAFGVGLRRLVKSVR